MSWKNFVTAGLLCVLASPAFAVPTLIVSGSINNKAAVPQRIWNVAVAPDAALDPLGSPLALEIGFVATGGNIVSVATAPNEAAAAAPAAARVEKSNPGKRIFGFEPLDVNSNNNPVGVNVSGNLASVYIGTGDFAIATGNANNRDLFTITTDASVTSLSWGGHYSTAGAELAAGGTTFPVGGVARIAQSNGSGAANYHDASYAGTSAALSALRFLGDMNGSGTVTNADVAQFGLALNNATQYKTNFPNLNILRGDINGSGSITNADVVRFGEVLNNIGISGSGSAVPEPASCMLIGLGLAFAAGIRRRRK